MGTLRSALPAALFLLACSAPVDEAGEGSGQAATAIPYERDLTRLENTELRPHEVLSLPGPGTTTRGWLTDGRIACDLRASKSVPEGTTVAPLQRLFIRSAELGWFGSLEMELSGRVRVAGDPLRYGVAADRVFTLTLTCKPGDLSVDEVVELLKRTFEVIPHGKMHGITGVRG